MGRQIAITCGVIVLVHLYVFLSAIIYWQLEGHSHVEGKFHYSEKYLLSAMRSWSPKMKDSKSSEFKSFMTGYRGALMKDDAMENKRAFRSMAKSYMFALTSITTVGNSGMTVTTVGGKSFYLASIITGIVLYVSMLHRISLPMVETMRYAADQIMWFKDEFGNPQKNPYPKATVMIMCNVILVVSILIFAVGGVFSGHSYLYGIFATYDSVLTVGNEKWLPLITHWSETVFVLSLTLFLLVELAIVYTTVIASLDAMTDAECSRIVGLLWKSKKSGGYEPLQQDIPEESNPLYFKQSDDPFAQEYDVIETPKAYPPPAGLQKGAAPESEEVMFAHVEVPDESGIYDDSEKKSGDRTYDQPEDEPIIYDKPEDEQVYDHPVPIIPEADNIYDTIEDVDRPDSSTTAQKPDDSQEEISRRESPDLPSVTSPDAPVSTSTPFKEEQAPLEVQLPQEVEPQKEAQSPVKSNGESEPYYETYTPQESFLPVPSRKSSSGGSEYSNISVSDYEQSLAAELEKSREFVESQHK